MSSIYDSHVGDMDPFATTLPDFEPGLGPPIGEIHTEAKPWMISAYFLWTAVLAIFGIVASIGQIHTRDKCQTFKSNKDKDRAHAFYIVSIITIVLCAITFLLAILALAFKVGTAQRIVKKVKEYKLERDFENDGVPVASGTSNLLSEPYLGSSLG